VDIKQGAKVASAVALLLGAVACGGDDGGDGEATGSDMASVKCQGINDCMGTSECAGPDGSNDCQGMNDCKGQGWVSVDSEQACMDAGGEVI